jgi:hypothetical protein
MISPRRSTGSATTSFGVTDNDGDLGRLELDAEQIALYREIWPGKV